MLRAARALSSGHFCGALYKHTGMRPSEYQQRLRISRARELLELSRKSADNIALSIGYEDVGGFRRVFRKIIGLTPSEYRHRFSRLGTTATTLGTDPPKYGEPVPSRRRYSWCNHPGHGQPRAIACTAFLKNL
jgi:hypothetical protein